MADTPPKEHHFAQYVRTVARGPSLSRPLTEAEALAATRMILKGEVEPLQLGAFLCVLRVRTEDPGEGAGFVRAVKETIRVPAGARADLDWSTYAGKKRQLPWFLLSALLLAANGVRVLMHGTEGHTPGRVYAREALAALGVPTADSLEDAAGQIERTGFSYLPLAAFVPRLQEILDLKPILGVRSPVNTFARMINPFDAPYSIQSIFHPNYREIHREISRLLGQPHMAVFKGEGGEIERRPEKPVTVESLHGDEAVDEDWPPMIEQPRVTDEIMDLARLKALWDGKLDDSYAAMTVVGTAAVALRLMGRAETPAEAVAAARRMWDARPAGILGAGSRAA
ncbi:MAG: glycosyl transferase family protein [Alphaproteobacteria bacterium]|nr:glycosyl transferase family protein [Alphaproteobacteria bacterium]